MYGKIFSTLFTGSMRGQGDLQLVFVYMITNATADGICDFTPQCIADATGKDLALVQQCIDELEAPDGLSRTTKDEGRRIVRLDMSRPWGWQVVNHAMYRAIASKDAMKEAERLRKRDYRSKKKETVPDKSRTTSGHAASVSASSSDPEGECEGVKQALAEIESAFERCWVLFGRYGTKQRALKYWRAIKPEHRVRIEQAIPLYIECVAAGRTKSQFEGWINPEHAKWDMDWRQALANLRVSKRGNGTGNTTPAKPDNRPSLAEIS